MSDSHVHDLIPSYILGLLNGDERRQVVGHLAGCAICRLAARRERALANLIHDTLEAAAQPDPERLQALRPAMPAHHLPATASLRLAWSRPLAALALLLIIFFAGLNLATDRGHNLWQGPVATYWPATATQTNTPAWTATATAVSRLPQEIGAADVPDTQGLTVVQSPQPAPSFVPLGAPRPIVTPAPTE